ncbi:hypothetical protein Tco_0124541, partial [Tanacetum coccineum]
ALITPIRLTFGEETDGIKGKDKEKGVVEVDDDLKKPYKEVLEPRRPHIPLHGSCKPRGMGNAVWCRMFQQTLDGPTRGWFDRMPNGYIDSWASLREKFIERFALRRRWSKDPTEGVPEVMQISAFMSNSKCPELARRFADQVPQTVTEMMKRMDDFVKSEEAFKCTELPRGSSRKKDTRRRTGDSDQHVHHKVEVRLRATFTTITTGEITTNHTFLRDNRP